MAPTGSKDGLPRVAEIFLGRDNRRDLIVAQVQKGDGGEFAHYVLSPDGVVQLAAFEDKIVEVLVAEARRLAAEKTALAAAEALD